MNYYKAKTLNSDQCCHLALIESPLIAIQVDRHRRSRNLSGRSLGPEGLLDLRHPRHHQTGLSRINWFKPDQPAGERSSSASREHWIIFKWHRTLKLNLKLIFSFNQKLNLFHLEDVRTTNPRSLSRNWISHWVLNVLFKLPSQNSIIKSFWIENDPAYPMLALLAVPVNFYCGSGRCRLFYCRSLIVLFSNICVFFSYQL